MTGGAFFSNILPPFAKAHTPVGPGEIGIVIFINTFLIVVAQTPATRVVKRMRRTHALAAATALFAIGLLAVLLATLTSSPSPTTAPAVAPDPQTANRQVMACSACRSGWRCTGGSMTAGPRAGGGYALRARLPLDPARS